ncbi:MAG: Large extracellular alpha-helical protein [Acidobacteria bacterium]|nr:Large extracellular alpha-helical protein [Acidobacteriota bacterium]
MKTIISITVLVLLLILNATGDSHAGATPGPLAQQPDYSQLKADAERAYAQGSYARAHELYAKANQAALPPAEARWVDFRLADTLWRAQAATETSDNTKIEQAQKQLAELIRTNDAVDERDIIWAEAHESLADFFWTRRNAMDWGSAWTHYQQALDWWAGQRDLERARDRYLKIVFKAAEPPRPNQYYFYSVYGNYIPLNILENALQISATDRDKAHLHYLIAMTMRVAGGDWEARQRVPEEFEAALHAGKQTPWYVDALYYYAEWMNSNGIIRQLDEGQWQQEPDYVKALELYRRLTREFAKGETRYFDQAQEQIKNITEATISASVSNIFLPDSELQFNLSARNVKRVDFALYKIDLTRNVRFTKNIEEEDGEGDSEGWMQKLPTAGLIAVKSWSRTLDSKTDHKPIDEEIRIEGKLPLGAYLLEARSGSLSSRDLVLITDVSLVLKASGKQALVYFCNAVTGAPVANAGVALWESYYIKDTWHWRKLRQTTNAEGLAQFQLRSGSYHNLFAVAASGERQAFAGGNGNGNDSEGGSWRIYAFTDRPAYRPKETVQWKFIARRMMNGVYSTPANQVVEYEITDPRGAKVSEGKANLNTFGSAWGSLELTEQLPLGEYRVQFWDQGRVNGIGTAMLFRLEEYKLPEFKVAVKTPEENGKKKSFRLGEKVTVNIEADYYFGGPVTSASVEVVVYQSPFYHYWYPHRDYAWYYEDFAQRGRYNYGGQGQVIKRETIKTDAAGKATLTFDTPRENYNQDFEYRIEARVTDSSRREIVSSDTVRVTRQRYYVYPQPVRNIYRPKDKVTVDFKALDANEQPVTTEGTVKVTRDYWWEVWIDPSGREVKGEELRLLRGKSAFPAPVLKGQKSWRLKFRGYQHDDIIAQTLKTDADGSAQLQFQAEREGYYRVAWQSSQSQPGNKRDRFLPPVKAETYVFVATNGSTDLGYRHDGVEIIVDKDTFRSGQTAPVMLFVPEGDRYVLFSVEGDDLFSYKLVHVTGTAKLIELPIEEKHIPNIYLNAAMVNDAQLFVDTKEVVVPPVQQFLSVDVKADREQYQPREEGTLAITTRDADGKPVAAEIALGIFDESVKYIQQDYAGDPRQFYYGTKRTHTVETRSTFDQKTYARLIEFEKRLIDSKEVPHNEDDEKASKDKSLNQNYMMDGADVSRARGGPPRAAAEIGSIAGLANRQDGSLPLNGRAIDKLEMRPSGTLQTPPPAPTPGQEPAVQVRSDFRSTILWLPDIKTDADGTASVKVKYPDSLTTWVATARVATAGNQFGIGNATTRTKQPLIVRLQAPRFFVVGDQVTVSAVINNNTDVAMRVTPALQAEGLTVAGLLIDGKIVKGAPAALEVKANDETRVDWLISAVNASEAKLKVEARGDKYADAMEKTFTVYEHGIEKFVSRSGKMRGDSVAIKLDIPKERRTETTMLTVQVAPGMATTMLDALPYLIDYPYGCTEQTMSRFLPAVITAKTLRDLGLKPETAMGKIFGGIETATATTTHPKGKHDLSELDAITKQSLARLYNFQHADGGWGWWKDGDSDHFMTAYVLWGMTLARQAGVDVRQDAAARAADYLDKELVEEDLNYDGQAWMLHALATYQAATTSRASKFQARAFENLWTNRDKLNAYTRSLLALSAHSFGYNDKAMTLVENLENGVKIDSKPDTSIVQSGGPASDLSVIGTAHWGEDGIYWRWSDGGVEATSFALRALLAIDPQNKLVEPVTNWLIKNRRGAQWSNTRDTAIVVLALNDYLRKSGELQPVLSYELLVNGNLVATKQVTAEDALSAPSKFLVSREFIRDGQNEILIRRKSGTGPLYFSAQAEFFSLEEPLTPAGNEIFVRRQYFKLVNHPTLLKGFVAERVPLNDGDTVKSGERVESVITIEAKNNYEYLLFEDLKPAGLEAVEIRSGESLFIKQLKSGALNTRKSTLMNFSQGTDFTGQTRWVYQELRDRKVALFIDHLPEGVWQMSYEMRAESPGAFHALPVLGHAMYVPEIRTNGAEVRIKVVD